LRELKDLQETERPNLLPDWRRSEGANCIVETLGQQLLEIRDGLLSVLHHIVGTGERCLHLMQIGVFLLAKFPWSEFNLASNLIVRSHAN
jgi:hypothetical protein